MHQNPLRILCAYYDPEPDWLGESPEDALEGHDIIVAHSYRDAKHHIIDPQRGVPSFDIVLADVALITVETVVSRLNVFLIVCAFWPIAKLYQLLFCFITLLHLGK